jgi:hypothetical protein
MTLEAISPPWYQGSLLEKQSTNPQDWQLIYPDMPPSLINIVCRQFSGARVQSTIGACISGALDQFKLGIIPTAFSGLEFNADELAWLSFRHREYEARMQEVLGGNVG